LFGGLSLPDHDPAAYADSRGALCGRFKKVFLDAGLNCIAVTAARGRRQVRDSYVKDMENDDLGTMLSGLRQSKTEGFLIDGDFGGEKDGGRPTPPWLDKDCHGHLLNRNLTINGLKLTSFVLRCIKLIDFGLYSSAEIGNRGAWIERFLECSAPCTV
jgi:hypothetical protein